MAKRRNADGSDNVDQQDGELVMRQPVISQTVVIELTAEIPDQVLETPTHPFLVRRTGRVDLSSAAKARGALARLMAVLVARDERVGDTRRPVQFPGDAFIWLLERLE